MASRNVNLISGLDPSDKLQSNTLKRQPNPDWSKNDLLRLLSYFEGELQARDITIAALRAEKAKNLLFQAKYGRFGLGDPFIALQRDSENMKDNSFDEPAIKSMYDNQLAQLENLIATQRKAQLKMREQLTSAEKRYHKVVAELEDEKRKHAQDTAQGDDVTYMLEKERERLKQEVDFEKSQTKRMEKDLKKTLASLEEERANSNKHKQVALMLIKERKRLMEKIFSETSKTSQFEQILGEEKDKIQNMAEGLVQESKKSLKMEAAMEKQINEFEVEREQLRSKLAREENRNKDLQVTVDSLNLQIENMQTQMQSMMERAAARDTVSSIEIKSSVSPGRISNPPSNSPAYPVVSGSKPATKPINKPGGMDTRGTTSSPERDYICRPDMGQRKPVPVVYGSPTVSSTSADRFDSRGEQRIAPVGASNADKPNDGSPVHRVNISPGSSATVVTPTGGKISLHVAGGGGSPRKVTPMGRGTPPPIPPNKPILNPGSQGPKPPPPPKVGFPASKDRVNALGADVAGGEHSSRTASPKSVQIPVNVGGQNVTSGSRTTTRDSSPMRKSTQGFKHSTCYYNRSTTIRRLAAAFETAAGPKLGSRKTAERRSKSVPGQASQCTGVVSPTSPALDFLGPEMADLHQMLAAMTTGERSAGSSSSLVSSSSSSLPSSSCSLDAVRNSPVHRHAASGELDLLQTLILERDADVNLPMKDGTTPTHCAAEGGHEDCLEFLLDKGGNPNALRDDLLSPVHLAAANGHLRCLDMLVKKGAVVNVQNQMSDTPLHMASTRGHHECCFLLLEQGARPFIANLAGLTPLHTSVIGNHVECVQVLLQYSLGRQNAASNPAPYKESLQYAVNMADKDGWTLAHMAACLDNEKCLSLLLGATSLDLGRKDRLGRSAFSVASRRCKDFLLNQTGNNNNHIVSVVVELLVSKMTSSDKDDQCHHYVTGVVEVTPQSTWEALEERCCEMLESYYVTLDTGLRTRKISRLDPEADADSSGYSLGLGTSGIKEFEMCNYKWTPGSNFEKLPYEILCNNHSSTLSVTLNNSNNPPVSVAYDTLYPLNAIKNYLRLLEQYKSVVFFGPMGSGKSYLTERLAQCIAISERAAGRHPEVFTLCLTPNHTNAEFVATLKKIGGIVPVHGQCDGWSPILLLENLETVNIAQLFGSLLDPIEYRGRNYAFRIKDGSTSENDSYFLPDNFYLLATMNRTRSTGLDLCIQQRFRWVHFRLDSEPYRNHLARYIHRRLLHLFNGHLPSPDNRIFKCAEWVVCLWQRLNDSLSKLGLPDLAFGPCFFFHCPLDKNQDDILHWVRDVWNKLVAPQVRDAVRRGTGSDAPSDGQQKVANTALYVLMQRSVVLGCPLSGKEREEYLSGFTGSNELDIPLKVEKRRSFTPHINGKDHKGTDNSSKPRESRAEMFNTSGVTIKHKSRNSEDAEIGLSNTKRRSLSESSVDRASRMEQENNGVDPLASQAKMPKLEIRSPILLPLANSLPSTSTNQDAFNNNSNIPSPGHRQHSSSSMSPKKSRSSENISSTASIYAAKRRSASPFSFSLATPTSSLNSFRFLEVKSPKFLSSPVSSQDSEPVVFTASPREKTSDIHHPNKVKVSRSSETFPDTNYRPEMETYRNSTLV